MELDIFVGIRNISSFSILLPLSVFTAAIYKKKQAHSVWLLGMLLLVSGLADLFSFLSYRYFHTNPNIVINIYGILQFLLLGYIYRAEYTRPLLKRLVDIISIAFIVFALVNFFFLQGPKAFNSNTFTVTSVVIMLFCLTYFYQIVQELPEPYIERMIMFWVGAAVFFYFGTNLFLFLTVDRMLPRADSGYLLSWGLHNGSNVVKNILFTIAMYMALFNKHTSPN